MTALMALGLCSVVGAILFFAAGYLSARARASSTTPSVSLPEAASPAQEPAALALAEERARELSRRLAEEQTGRRAVEASLTEQQARVKSVEDRLAAREAEARASEQRTLDLQARLGSAEEQARARAQEQEALHKALDQARRERDQVSQQLSALEESLGDREERTVVRPDLGLHVSLEQAEQRGLELEQQVAALTLVLEQLRSERNMQAAQIADLTAKLSEQKKRASQAQAPDAAFKLKLNEVTVEKQRLQTEVAALQMGQKEAGRLVSEAREEARRLSEELVVLRRERETASGAARELVAMREKLHSRTEELDKQRQLILGLEKQLEEAKAESARQRAQVGELSSRCQGLQTNEVNLRKSLDESTNQVADLRSRLAAADGKVARVERLEEDLLRTRQEAEALRQEASGLRALESAADERRDLALQLEAMRQRGVETEALREEKDRLVRELREVRSEGQTLTDRVRQLDAVEEERQDLRIRLQVQQQQLEELSGLRDELQDLREQAAEARELRQRVEQLLVENAAMRSLGLTREAPPRPSFESSSTMESHRTLGDSLNALLARLDRLEALRSAALADQAGLPVAARGEHAEALCALGAIFMDSATRLLKGILPLGPVQQIAIQDENALTLAIHPFPLTEEPLLLCTLTAKGPPNPQTLQDMMQDTTDNGNK